MWAVADLSLRKMREGSLGILILIGIVLCVLADSASPVADQLERGSLFSYALGSQSLKVSPITAGSGCALIFSLLLGVFWGASEIPGDINTGLVMVVLSKPVGRIRYLLGKFLALILATVSLYLACQIVLAGSHWLLGTGAEKYSWALVGRQLLPVLMLFPLIAVTMLFSLIAGSMGSMVFTLLYLVFSLMLSFLPVTLSLLPEGTLPGLELGATLLHYFFPNWLYFVHDGVVEPFLALMLGLYTVALTTLFGLGMVLRIRNMDLNR